jgi:hypothetical protein
MMVSCCLSHAWVQVGFQFWFLYIASAKIEKHLVWILSSWPPSSLAHSRSSLIKWLSSQCQALGIVASTWSVSLDRMSRQCLHSSELHCCLWLHFLLV